MGFALPAGAPDWIEPFDPIQQTGVGSFTIDPGALIGAQDTGVIHIEYQLFPSTSVSVNAPSLCDPFCSGSIELPFQVNVVASAPEPATWAVGLLGLAFLMIGSARNATGWRGIRGLKAHRSRSAVATASSSSHFARAR